MGEFQITIKEDVLLERVAKAQMEAIDRIAQQYNLPKGELNGDGVDPEEAKHLGLDIYLKLSGGDTKITRADIVKFAGVETKEDIIKEYAQKIRDSLPAKVLDISSTPEGTPAVSTIAFEVKPKSDGITLTSNRITIGQQNGNSYVEASAAGVFSIINGKDLNKDGKISIAGELKTGEFIKTVGDALKIADGDYEITPTEALKAVLDRAGKVATSDVIITYNK